MNHFNYLSEEMNDMLKKKIISNSNSMSNTLNGIQDVCF